jgi:hypothetical protein
MKDILPTSIAPSELGFYLTDMLLKEWYDKSPLNGLFVHHLPQGTLSRVVPPTPLIDIQKKFDVTRMKTLEEMTEKLISHLINIEEKAAKGRTFVYPKEEPKVTSRFENGKMIVFLTESFCVL